MTALNTLSLWHDDSVILLDAFGWAILYSIWQLTAVGIAVAFLVRLLSQQSAESRHLVLCIALLTMLLLPAGTLITHVIRALAREGSGIVAGPSAADFPADEEHGVPDSTPFVDLTKPIVTDEVANSGD